MKSGTPGPSRQKATREGQTEQPPRSRLGSGCSLSVAIRRSGIQIARPYRRAAPSRRSCALPGRPSRRWPPSVSSVSLSLSLSLSPDHAAQITRPYRRAAASRVAWRHGGAVNCICVVHTRTQPPSAAQASPVERDDNVGVFPQRSEPRRAMAKLLAVWTRIRSGSAESGRTRCAIRASPGSDRTRIRLNSVSVAAPSADPSQSLLPLKQACCKISDLVGCGVCKTVLKVSSVTWGCSTAPLLKAGNLNMSQVCQSIFETKTNGRKLQKFRSARNILGQNLIAFVFYFGKTACRTAWQWGR